MEISWESQRALDAADSDDLILDRLAHHFQHARAEFGQFVNEEHSAVCQGNLAGMGQFPPPTSLAREMVRGAEGT